MEQLELTDEQRKESEKIYKLYKKELYKIITPEKEQELLERFERNQKIDN